ncbi:DUF1657 domain-containing protein [Peribacillus sp. SCS-37]|uniref:DUF1657 domain-containing protein n=1 Tax=Paraperibacillus esterisolvens TaxID=3115296 RepID=UPI003905B7A0
MTAEIDIKKTLASLKGIEAQLSIQALSSRDKSAQAAFHEAMVRVGEIKHTVQRQLYTNNEAE